MFEELQTFYTNNTTMIIIAGVALIAMLGMFMFKQNIFNKSNANIDSVAADMPNMDEMSNMSGMSNMNNMSNMNEMSEMSGMCDSSNDVCYSHEMMNASTLNDSSNVQHNGEPNFENNTDLNIESQINSNYDSTIENNNLG